MPKPVSPLSYEDFQDFETQIEWFCRHDGAGFNAQDMGMGGAIALLTFFVLIRQRGATAPAFIEVLDQVMGFLATMAVAADNETGREAARKILAALEITRTHAAAMGESQ